MDSPEKRAVRDVVARINRAWQTKDFGALPDCFAQNAAMAGPDYTVLGRGRSFFVESYREFANSAEVLEYSESKPLIEVFDRVAICAYPWTTTYRRDGERRAERGSDPFVLSRSAGRWRVVWRYISFQPSQ